MHIDYTMSKYNTSYKYAKGLYQNFMNNCFLCDKFLNKTSNINNEIKIEIKTKKKLIFFILHQR